MNTLDNIIEKFSHIEPTDEINDLKEDFVFFEEELSKRKDELEVSEDEEEVEKINSDIIAITKAQKNVLVKINKLYGELDAEYQAKAEADKKAEDERKAKENTPPTPPEPPKPTEPEKKKGGIGWMLFGAVALVVTMGAVNVMNKK